MNTIQRAEQLAKMRKLSGSASESQGIFREEARSRKDAHRVLDPNEVGGEYDLSRELETTLNGESRPLTTQDLAQFRRRVGVLKTKVTKNKIQGGIRAQQVIHMATPSPGMTGIKKEGTGIPTDIQRANKEIHMAVLARANKGVLSFITNAGPDSKDTRHHVNIQLMSFSAAVSMPRKGKQGAIKAARFAANEPLRFDCDCGRHTFWFRYVASIGGWNHGRNENGYPKIRNPRLIGVACKHVLRVMRELIGSRNIHGQIARMIESDRSIRFKQKETDKIARSQKKQNKQLSPSRSKRESKKLLTKIDKNISEKKLYKKPNINKAKLELKGMLERGLVTTKQYNDMARALA